MKQTVICIYLPYLKHDKNKQAAVFHIDLEFTLLFLFQCGKPAVQSTCQECRQPIGGQGYRLAAGRTIHDTMYVEHTLHL